MNATTPPTSAPGRFAAAGYGYVTYVLFFATFVYAVGFVEGLVVPKGIDDGAESTVAAAVIVNAVLLALFALQHSIMARPAFKRWWTRIAPPPVERTTYVLLSTGALALLMWLWRPIPDVIWNIDGQPWRGLIYAVSFAGWALVLASTFAVDHFDMFGIRQVTRYLRGKGQAGPPFRTTLLYRLVRHPLMLGFLIAFWAAPTMTAGHLLFSAAATGYILVGVQLEERDLITEHGEAYQQYREQVPMLVPGATRRYSHTATE